MNPLSNRDLGELLAAAARNEKEHRQRALRRASRAALTWPEEAAALAEDGRSLTELRSVGPWVARIIEGWLEEPPDVPEPPPERRGFLTVAEARTAVEAHPEWRAELRADLQVHTTYSDGKAPLEDMAELLRERGYSHAAITDHSKGLPIAGGMHEERLAQQGRHIEEVNASFDGRHSSFRLLRSIEMNLSPEGEGDMEPEALGRLDLVLGAFHSNLRVTDDQTERYVAAVRNPTVQVLAHPRCRKFGRRLGLWADWPAVFGAAAEAGTAVEIDASPDRQDLDVDLVRVAAEAGAWLSIGTDAHYPHELGWMDLGLAAAILGGAPRER
ncbi:MAG TPA: PHP domain-containing protein, partial [Actinomycetota bacterium]|nr:PHP domain-containing protein [Actinomycetota bacterium]